VTPIVSIHYRRLPSRTTVFRQRLVHREAGCAVTLMERTPLPAPVSAGGRAILEPGAPVVWFTFDDAWHDIGRFHTSGGTFTGFYANVLSPVHFVSPLHWTTTDLCLDVWLDADGDMQLLDQDELDEALRAGWLDDATAARARTEADTIMGGARAGDWPPQIVRDWPLDRALDVCADRAP
jgi:predicted RNA-binding protein associated with RNAse of E/G family